MKRRMSLVLVWFTLALLFVSVSSLVSFAAWALLLKAYCGAFVGPWTVDGIDTMLAQLTRTDVECIGGGLSTRLEWVRLLVPLAAGFIIAGIVVWRVSRARFLVVD